MENTSPTKKPGITLEDVRAALGETSPLNIGGAALRERLGRGSLETIQKHLKALREAQSAAAKPPDDDVPAPDSELVRAIWSAAWSMARQKTLVRLEALSAQRDSALAQITTLENDSVSLAQALDKKIAQADSEANEAAQSLEAQRQVVLQVTTSAEGLATQVEQLRAENQRMSTESGHQRQLAERDAQLKDRNHQADREHLLNQIAELKSALHTVSVKTAPPKSEATV